MSEYVIKADSGFTQLNVSEIDSQTGNFSTLSALSFDYNDIDDAAFQRMWSSAGGYIDAKHTSSTRIDNTYNNMIGSTITSSGGTYDVLLATPHLFVFSFVWGTDLYVMWENASSMGDLINKMEGFSGSFPASNTLYKNTVENAKSQDIMMRNDWDETPASDEGDPDHTLPQGGAYADTDPLGYGNDEIDIPDTVQELSYSGFITAYQLDAGEVIAIGEAIFTTSTWTNLWNKFNGVGDPINYIISAVEIPYNARDQSVKNFNLGGVSVDGPNGPVALHVMNQRFHVLDFGSLTLKETWGTEKDYSTTDVAIYLPYVGVKDLDTSILMNSSIQVKCILDSWNGELLYVVVVSNKAAAHKYLGSKGIVYRFSGNCGTVVPIGKVDYSSQILAMAGSFAAMGVGLATGMPTGALSYTIGNEFGATGDMANGVNPKMVGGGLAGMMGALTMGPKVSMAGGSGGAVARGDYQKPYLIIKQSVPVYPANWRAHFGAPRYQEFTLSDLTGYVQCADVHADSIEGANDVERAAIEQALKAGVFID